MTLPQQWRHVWDISLKWEEDIFLSNCLFIFFLVLFVKELVYGN